jgi:hypothetical protein
MKNKTVVKLNIELPTDLALDLEEIFWTRIELLVSDVFRIYMTDTFTKNPPRVHVWRA